LFSPKKGKGKGKKERKRKKKRERENIEKIKTVQVSPITSSSHKMISTLSLKILKIPTILRTLPASGMGLIGSVPISTSLCQHIEQSAIKKINTIAKTSE